VRSCEECGTNEAVFALLDALPQIRETVKLDVEAAYAGDPAATSYDEIILSYPGIKAITIQRMAHVLYHQGVPFIPRMMTEHAHSQTGIDIHPGAHLGRGVFIDHGTGVVIGETAVIGDNVRIYQGVTLGAGNFPKDACGMLIKGNKRHPTIGNNVMISAGAKVLGSFTIGDNSKIGAGSVVLSEVPPGSTVVGVPGRVVKRNTASLPQETMNQTDLPDPVREDITVLQRENSELTNRVLEMEDELKQLRRLVVMSAETGEQPQSAENDKTV